MYYYDEKAIGTGYHEKFVHMIHVLAAWVAACNNRPFSLVPTVKEVAAREREAAAWNPPFRYNGD